MLARFSAGFRWALVAAMILAAALLMLNASRGDSGIIDELAHIPAGYSYVRYLDYRLNPEHPPLVKALAGLPLLFQDLNFPTDRDPWAKDINGQWAAGAQFLYESDNDADNIIFAARFGPIILTLILILVIYLLAKDLIGRWWALLPTFLVAFSPTLLAHGHYVTTDVAATLGTVVATWAFLNFLNSSTRKNLVLAGLAFGFAQITKFSAFLLAPYFVILAVVFYLVGKMRGWQPGSFWWHIKSLLYIFLIGLALIYVIYFFLTLNYPIEKQVSDTEFILTSFSPRFLPEFTTLLAQNHITRPAAEYLLGLLMVLQRSSGGNTVYFLGEVTAAGSRLYFPLVFLMKEPIPSLLMILFAFGFSIWEALKGSFSMLFRRGRNLLDYLATNFTEFAMLLFIVIYWLSSVTSNLNIGVRHILPTLPFIYILSAGAIKNWFSFKNLEAVRNFAIKIFVLYQELVSVSIKSAILGALLLWYFISTLLAAPHFLSYFNIAAGGLTNGWRHVTDSNYDWGQDLKRLKAWVDENLPPGERIAVDYFGAGSAKYYLGERAEHWWSSRGTPAAEGIKWLAVSVNTIQGARGRLHPGHVRNPEDEYQWLKEPYKPFARGGPSIFIYKLE